MENQTNVSFSFNKGKNKWHIGFVVVAIVLFLICVFGMQDVFYSQPVMLAIMLLAICELVYIYLLFRKQRSMCEEMQISVQEDKRTIAIENKGKIIELPYDKIKEVHYYSSELFKGAIGAKDTRMPLEHMTIVMQDGQVVYLGYFYKLFEYMQNNQDTLPFPLEIHTFRLAHLPNRYNLMSGLYGN